jgi:hypothetical protein
LLLRACCTPSVKVKPNTWDVATVTAVFDMDADAYRVEGKNACAGTHKSRP